MFDHVEVFTATKANDRRSLGVEITNWLRDSPRFQVMDYVVTQSSDQSFHCLSITLFCKELTE